MTDETQGINGQDVRIIAPTKALAEAARDVVARRFTRLETEMTWITGLLDYKLRDAPAGYQDVDDYYSARSVLTKGIDFRRAFGMAVEDLGRPESGLKLVHSEIGLVDKVSKELCATFVVEQGGPEMRILQDGDHLRGLEADPLG